MTNRDRMQSATIRAKDAYTTARRRCERLSEELDEITDHGSRVPASDLDNEDSAVIVIDEVREEVSASAARVVALVAVK